MPYVIKKIPGQKKYAIIDATTHKVVGHSTTTKKAYGSIAHRMDAEHLSSRQAHRKDRRARA